MQAIKTVLRVIGAAAVFFGMIHLYLNLYIVSAHFMMAPADVKSLLVSLSKALGPIAVPDDAGLAVFFVKTLAGLSFLAVGGGIMLLKRWSRKPLLVLLALRLLYAVIICAHYKVMYSHFWLIVAEFAFPAYYLTRQEVKSVFEKNEGGSYENIGKR